MNASVRRLLTVFGIFLGVFLAIRYLLPLIFPFILGAALAFASEPMVRFGCVRLRMPRPLAAGIGISMAFSFLTIAIVLLAALLMRELCALRNVLPAVEGALRNALDGASVWLLDLAAKAPGSLSDLLTAQIQKFFSGSSALLDQAFNYLLRLASGILSRVPGRALSFGTGILASYMISAKLPKIKAYLRSRAPAQKLQTAAAAWQRLKQALGGWLKAQLKLSGVTFLLVCAGLLLLRVSGAPFWAALIAVVDAFPVLGTGSVLVPWSLVSFLQGDHLLAFGLLGLYAAVTVTRTVLEPRLVGKHLGLDPLVTLMALYVGFKLFGLPGLIFAPLLAVTASQLLELKTEK